MKTELKNTLLIVDDDEIIVVLLKSLFEKKYNIVTANDGTEAIQYLSQGIMPNLIISDLMMKNVNGFEFIQYILTNKLYHNIPVIVVSSSVVTELSEKFPSVQFVDKPFDPVKLKQLVDVFQA